MDVKKVISEKCKLKNTNSQYKLLGWLAARGISNTEIARALGISDSFIGMIFLGHRGLPYKHWVKMVEFGIPADLLPVPGKPRKGDVVVDKDELLAAHAASTESDTERS